MKRLSVAFVLILLAASSALAALPQPVTIPAGTEIHFKLSRGINTANAKAGQNVPGTLTSPITIHGRTVAASGASVNVHITRSTTPRTSPARA